ncbi:MAG: class I SAM-dependent methyltransferase [Saprospiraceae bacterium]|jgi:2-polyprenyl-3-methyl-5-hydroxy-6-metoxy-1,4-benzoquinol methylase|nr:class I SAM-dependent methyltransferase [Saprospiraceae bacterium]
MSLDTTVYAFQSAKIGKTNSLEIIENEFKEKAKWYNVFLNEFLPKDKNIKIIDLPCGHGNMLYFLKSKGYTNYIGYDIDPGRIEIAKGLGLKCELADGLLAIKAEKDIDIIFSLDFLEHINKEDAFSYISDCYQCLKIGGKLIVVMPITDIMMGTFDLYNDLTHKWSYNSICIITLFEIAGFSKVVVKDERPVLYKPTNYLRLLLFMIFSRIHNFYLTLLGFSGYKLW